MSRVHALVDTDVYSILYVPRGKSADTRRDTWRELLVGRKVLLSFMSHAELLAGSQINAWGPARIEALGRQLNLTPTIPADQAVIEAYATVTAWARHDGHPIHQKTHTGDRWIAASAIAYDVALLSGDSIFQGIPMLTLLESAQS